MDKGDGEEEDEEDAGDGCVGACVGGNEGGDVNDAGRRLTYDTSVPVSFFVIASLALVVFVELNNKLSRSRRAAPTTTADVKG